MVLSRKRSQRGGRRCGMVGSKKQRGGRRCGMVGNKKQRGGSKKQRGGSKKQRGGRRCGMVGNKKQRGGYPNVYRVSTMRGGFGGYGHSHGSYVSGSPIERKNQYP